MTKHLSQQDFGIFRAVRSHHLQARNILALIPVWIPFISYPIKHFSLSFCAMTKCCNLVPASRILTSYSHLWMMSGYLFIYLFWLEERTKDTYLLFCHLTDITPVLSFSSLLQDKPKLLVTVDEAVHGVANTEFLTSSLPGSWFTFLKYYAPKVNGLWLSLLPHHTYLFSTHCALLPQGE